MKYDAIIVLGGGVNYDGSVNDISKYKVDSAAELFNSHLAPRMIMSTKWSGFLPKKPKSTESESMKRYAMQLGVPESAILKEDESLDTIGNALYTKQKYLIPNNWKKNNCRDFGFPHGKDEIHFPKSHGTRIRNGIQRIKIQF